ncbi:myosin essential light chain, striated adductor muscle-like [Gigantopelta aegis]|uniref:myosin essential light chain, striated adductor muscle-like n=1 Tax=Gigantopelta aegis TaxID=1735272 RepID=UPI001B887615|nr:myosin essential light chain, striated adductor muscle-like [Gigantopelta aegis]
MATTSKAEMEDVREVFDLFDFWDGRDGLIDAVKVGDLLRCVGLNPTVEMAIKHGGTKKAGEKQLAFEEFLASYEAVKKEKDVGTYKEFVEAMKSFDREGQGYISAAEMRHMLTAMGERLTDAEVDEIIRLTDTREDLEGNVKYEDFINKVLKGPDGKDI